MPTLEQHFSYLEAAIAEARASPLSTRKARLAMALVDSYADRLYAADSNRAEDILAFRVQLAAANPALAVLLAVAEARPGAPQLRLEPTGLSSAEYQDLTEAEFMVSLYNDATIPSLTIVGARDARFDAHSTLRDALAALRTASPPPAAD